MKTGHTLHLLEPFDGFDADIDSLFSLLFFGCAGQPLNDFIGHIHAGDPFFHVPGHAHVLHGGQSCQNVNFFMQSAIPDLLHPFFKFIQVVDALGLDEFRSGSNFLCQPGNADFKRIGKRVGRRADKHLRRAFDIVAAEKFALIAHVSHCLEQLHGVQIVNILALSVITEALVVAGKT